MPMSKPTNIDAQRILAIMDELKEKLTYLSVVTSQVLDGLQSEEGQQTCELVGPDLVKMLAEQIRLEDLYMVANAQAEGGFGHAQDSDDVNEDVKSLKKNTLELCRKMKSVQNIVQELRNFQEQRPTAVIQFLKTLADMQELTLKRLTTTVEEERSRQELLEHYRSRETEASRRRQQLEKDLNHIRRECERAITVRTEILTKLKADLLDVRDSKDDRMNTLRQRYETRMKEHEDAFNAKKDDLEKKIGALRTSNKTLRGTSQEEEMVSKSKAKRLEKDVDNIIKQYDQQVKKDAFELNEHQDVFKKEQRQLNELQEHFEKVDSEKECIAHEEAVVDARRSKLDQERDKRNASSSLVQAFWRGIIQREAYHAMRKNKKKKGGGKKKK